jgi:MFS transporter, YNFM family, putative membrane transport protein
MPQVFVIFAACAFASGFALRVVDPLILPIALQFSVAPAAAALLSAAFALPYALAQPFLGPLGDRFGKPRCIQVCIAATALALLLGCVAPSFEALVASRIVAGVFAGGLIPLVLAGIGDGYALHERQVTIGRLLLAIITGQMLGSSVAGFVNDAFGWRIALLIAAVVGTAAAGLAWAAMPAEQLVRPAPDSPRVSFTALYGRVFDNPKAKWLYGAVILEACFVFGAFPYVGQYLIERAGSSVAAAPSQAGLVLGAFGVGGLAYALSVRRLIAWLGVRRMCVVGSCAAAAAYAALAVLQVWWLAALAMLFAGGSYYMVHNSLQTEATEIAPTARGSAVALFACGFFAGQGLGPVLFGALVHAWGFPAALLICAAGLVGLGQGVVRRIIA